MLKMNYKRDFECGIWNAYVLLGLSFLSSRQYTNISTHSFIYVDILLKHQDEVACHIAGF